MTEDGSNRPGRQLRALATAMAALASTLVFGAVPALGQGAEGGGNFQVDDNDAECPTAAFSSIQAAVDAAPAGTQITVCPGSYAEQVSISGAAKNNISLVSQGDRTAVIRFPATVPSGDEGDLVTVDGATGVTIRGFRITGPYPDSLGCGEPLYTGVRVKGAGQATIDDNRITRIRSLSEGLRGCQNGFGIGVGGSFAEESGRATIDDNQIDTCQKGGIYADGPRTRVAIRRNLITGIGPDETIAQNGVQVSRNATASVFDNRVFDNTYAGGNNPDPGDDPGQASGVILFDLPGNLTFRGNTISRSDTNIALYNVDSGTFTDNRADAATFYDGIYADRLSRANVFTANTALSNEDQDCRDESEGRRTDGTANTWTNNVGDKDEPNLICRRVNR